MARLTKNAARALADLPASLQTKANNVIALLDSEPALGKKLLGALSGKRSARLGRTHRIIYVTEPEIVVIAITLRRDAYR